MKLLNIIGLIAMFILSVFLLFRISEIKLQNDIVVTQKQYEVDSLKRAIKYLSNPYVYQNEGFDFTKKYTFSERLHEMNRQQNRKWMFEQMQLPHMSP